MQDPLMDDDPALDREIREALAAEPSPEFLARVRRRLDAEPATAVAPWWWTAAAGLAIAAAAIGWLLFAREPAPRPRTAPLSGRAVPTVTIPSVTPAPLVTGRPSTGVVASAAPIDRAPAGRSPEVLIDERESRAIVAFLDAAAAGRVVVMPLPEPEPIASPELRRNLYIAPIVIESLSTSDRAEGVPK